MLFLHAINSLVENTLVMTHFSITIPDDKASFFKELLQSLSFAKIEYSESKGLTEAHKKILDQRLDDFIKDSENYLNWDNVQQEIEKSL